MIGPALRLAGALIVAAPAQASEQASEPAVETVAVEIRVEGDTAYVLARYRYGPGSRHLELNALGIDGQTLELEPMPGPVPTVDVPSLESLAGLHRLRIAPGVGVPEEGTPLEVVAIRYRVTGDLRRVPLFVPVLPLAEDREAVEIRIAGLPAAMGREIFPRMRSSGGELVANLANLPSFVSIPPTDRRISFGRAADMVVLLIILLASGWWIRAQRRAQRRRRGQGVRV